MEIKDGYRRRISSSLIKPISYGSRIKSLVSLNEVILERHLEAAHAVAVLQNLNHFLSVWRVKCRCQHGPPRSEVAIVTVVPRNGEFKKLYFTYESRNTFESFTLFINVKIITKLNLGHGDKFKIEMFKTIRGGSRSSDNVELRQRNVPKIITHVHSHCSAN